MWLAPRRRPVARPEVCGASLGRPTRSLRSLNSGPSSGHGNRLRQHGTAVLLRLSLAGSSRFAPSTSPYAPSSLRGRARSHFHNWRRCWRAPTAAWNAPLPVLKDRRRSEERCPGRRPAAGCRRPNRLSGVVCRAPSEPEVPGLAPRTRLASPPPCTRSQATSLVRTSSRGAVGLQRHQRGAARACQRVLECLQAVGVGLAGRRAAAREADLEPHRAAVSHAACLQVLRARRAPRRRSQDG